MAASSGPHNLGVRSTQRGKRGLAESPDRSKSATSEAGSPGRGSTPAVVRLRLVANSFRLHSLEASEATITTAHPEEAVAHCSKQYSRDAGIVEHTGVDEPAVHAWPNEFAPPKLPVFVAAALVQFAQV